jgi:hypothetical protein
MGKRCGSDKILVLLRSRGIVGLGNGFTTIMENFAGRFL